MGHRQVKRAALFYEFSLEEHVPPDHLLRSIDRFVELGEVRRELAPFYSAMGGPSIDPEPMIRMLIVGYCFAIRILKLDRLRLRGSTGAHDAFLLAAIAQNLRKLAKLVPIPSLMAA